ncbi:hypothetical protein HYT01_03315 [Candidatus Giovannonibacteria bacterium]|nr:hypothetical protein [Candidatus Giovannonibacteria bacterium]
MSEDREEMVKNIDRRIIADYIARDPVGRGLTKEAREAAILHALSVRPKEIGYPEAVQMGIKHAASNV